MFVNPHVGSPLVGECCSRASFKRSEVVYSQGDTANAWYEIISGSVRTCFINRNGQRQVTAFYYDGDVFGVDNGSYAESAEAVTDLVVRAHRLGPHGERAGDIDGACDAADIFRRALDLSRQRVVLLGRKTALQRVAAFILSLPAMENDSRLRFLPMSRTDIADHLCLTIHTVSRIISNLSRHGIIGIEGKRYLIIKGLDDLREIAGDDCIAADEYVGDSLVIHRTVVNSHEYPRYFAHKS